MKTFNSPFLMRVDDYCKGTMSRAVVKNVTLTLAESKAT